MEEIKKKISNSERKTKRPRLDLSLGTYVDQPSPKCCSKTRLLHDPKLVNGPCVPLYGTKVEYR